MERLVRRLLVIVCFFLFSGLFLSGCASHKPLKQPNLGADLAAQQTKETHHGVEVMIRAVHQKDLLSSYYDEDLILYGVLPVQVCIDNLSDQERYLGVEYATLLSPDGIQRSPLSLEEVFDRAKKSYWRTAGWGVAFGLLGAVPSIINVSSTNEQLKADYDSSMLKSGNMVEKARAEGSVFFEVDPQLASLDGWQFKIGLEKEGEPFYVSFDLSGEVEQPRVEQQQASK
jgi:hypothetical protein